MNITKKLFFLSAFAVTLVSCSDDDSKGNTLELSYNSCFNYVVDRLTGSSYIDDELEYHILYNFDTSTADIDIYSFNLSADKAARTLRLEGLPLKASGSQYVVDVPTVVAADITFTDFKFTISDRLVYNKSVGWFSSPVAVVSYNAAQGASNYAVTTYMRSYVYMDKGTTVTGGDEPYTSKNTFYQVTLNPKDLKASIFIDGPTFAANMPSTLRMTYPDIPLQLTPGGFKLAAQSIIPTLPDGDKQVQAPGYQISDLTAVADVLTGMTLDYKCTMQPKGAPAPVTYTVNTKLAYVVE